MSSKHKKELFSSDAPAPVGPYSQAVISDPLIFVSGQLGMTPAGVLANTVEEQAQLALENLLAILSSAGCTMDSILKTTVFLDNMDNFAAVNGVYAGFFSEPYPARAAFEVSRLPLNAKVEIEAVARLKER